MAKQKKSKDQISNISHFVERKIDNSKFFINHIILMRKFKISHELAQNVMDIIIKLNLDESWIPVEKSLPLHRQSVMVYGKPLIDKYRGDFSCFSAYLDATCGWIIDVNDHEHLYVTHWMAFPTPPNSNIVEVVNEEE